MAVDCESCFGEAVQRHPHENNNDAQPHRSQHIFSLLSNKVYAADRRGTLANILRSTEEKAFRETNRNQIEAIPPQPWPPTSPVCLVQDFLFFSPLPASNLQDCGGKILVFGFFFKFVKAVACRESNHFNCLPSVGHTFWLVFHPCTFLAIRVPSNKTKRKVN